MKFKNALQSLKEKTIGRSPGKKMKLSNKRVIGAAVVAFAVVLTVALIHPERTNALKRIEENTSKTYYRNSANNMYIHMIGPSGTSTLQIRASWGGASNTSASTFRGQARHVKLTGKITSKNNPYKLLADLKNVYLVTLTGTDIGLTQTRVRIILLTHGGVVLAAPTSVVFIAGAGHTSHINPPHTNQ